MKPKGGASGSAVGGFVGAALGLPPAAPGSNLGSFGSFGQNFGLELSGLSRRFQIKFGGSSARGDSLVL